MNGLRPRLTATLLLCACLLTPAALLAQEGALSLERCLDLAYEHSPELARAQQDLLSARAGLLGAYGSFLPTIDGSVGYGHTFEGPKPGQVVYNPNTFEFIEIDPTPSSDRETYSFSLGGSWTLFSGLSRFADLKAQRLGLAASEADLELARHQLEGSVIQAYYDLVKAQMLVELNRSSVQASREQYDQSRRAFSMGAVARSDTLRSGVRFAEARLNLLEAENSRQLANLALGTAIGAGPGRHLEVERLAMPSLVRVDRDEAVGAVLAEHPELRAAGYRQEAAEAQIGQAKAGLWPSVGASYRYSWFDLDAPDDLGTLFDQDYNYSVSLGLSWSVFDGFRTKRGINQARASARAQEYTLEQRRRGIVQALESTLVTLENSRKRVELARATIELAREDLRLARERYRVGAATLLEVTEADVSLIQAQVTEIEGVTSYLTALAELERVTGLEFGR